ncbi:ferredoxin [Bacteroidota bacterium]
MATYKIVNNLEECIGCGACAAVSDNWEIVEVDGEEKGKPKKAEFGDAELPDNKEAMESCPVETITITNKDSGKKVN